MLRRPSPHTHTQKKEGKPSGLEDNLTTRLTLRNFRNAAKGHFTLTDNLFGNLLVDDRIIATARNKTANYV